jgi:branched-chain amino acid transport system substrate-binding protein
MSGTRRSTMNKLDVSLGLGLVVMMITATWAAGCGSTDNQPLKIAVVLPLQITPGTEMLNAAQLALEEAGNKAGPYQVELLALDEFDESGSYTEEKARANAQTIVNDPDVVACLGPGFTAVAKMLTPLLNEAGIVMVAPSPTWPGLTKPGFVPGEPGIYYPTGRRNFFRVIPTDDLQGAVGALWARELGADLVYVVDDGQPYGQGVAGLFVEKAREIGLEVIVESADIKTTDYNELAMRIAQTQPDLIYFGGSATFGGPQLILALRNHGIPIPFMGPEGMMTSEVLDQAGAAAEGIYLTFGIVPFDQMGSRGAAFVEDYRAKYGEEPSAHAALTYDAMRVILDAISRAEDRRDRAAVLRAVAETHSFPGLSGDWGFDTNGDITTPVFSGYVVQDGEFVFKTILPTK